MKYLRKFTNDAAYEAATLNYPSVSLIDSTGEVKYDPIVPGPEMVDLGLTSGNLWAANNIGAEPGLTATSYYGNYYAWGEVETKSDYSWATYLRHSDGLFDFSTHKNSFKKYINKSEFVAEGYTIDNKLVLDAVDDIVTTTYGISYIMPTDVDIQELIDETDNEWVTAYNGITGLNGRKFMKKSDHTIFIFIPAATRNGEYCNLWSSSLFSNSPSSARLLYFDINSIYVSADARRYVDSVRAIKRVSQS